MAKPRETFNKKELEKRKQQKRKEKEERKEFRKSNEKGPQSLEDMMAYVDENGNLSTSPPDPNKIKKVRTEDIVTGSRNISSGAPVGPHNGVVISFNTSKGYGFIRDTESGESIFVHVNDLQGPVGEGDRVTFETARGLKGINAIKVKPVK